MTLLEQETMSLNLVWLFGCFCPIFQHVSSKHSLFLSSLPAPSQAPSNIMWIQDGSHISLGWEPVKPLANESDVMGYKVSFDISTILFSGMLCSFIPLFFLILHCALQGSSALRSQSIEFAGPDPCVDFH